MVAVLEPRAGILFPETCVETHLALARRRGAKLHFDEPVLRWQPDGGGVRVFTTKGEYQAGQLLLTTGSWITSLVPELRLPLTVERQIQFWFEPKNSEWFQPDRCPIHIWEHEPGKYFYGFPDLGEGVKVAGHHEGAITSADSINRNVSDEEVQRMRELVRKFLPGADGPLRSAVVCMYTNTRDGHFFIDRHPQHRQVLMASPCSGHGFKFSSFVGEALAELLIENRTRFDLGLFRTRV
jgi:sarcosine oxidase